MTHVLLVEDDENKRSRITEYYCKQFPDDNFTHADAMVTGLRAAREVRPDLIILDMTLPNYSISAAQGYNPMRPFGGRDFLRQLLRLDLVTKVVILTQFETFGSPPNLVNLSGLNDELRMEFDPVYLGSIYYHASKASWQAELSMYRENMEPEEA